MLTGGILLVEWERLSVFDPSYINLHGNTLQYACLRTGLDNEKRIDESRFFSTLT